MSFIKIGAAVACVLALSACGDNLFGKKDPYETPTSSGVNIAANPSSIEYFKETIGDRVLFVVNQSSLTPEGIETLNGQANWLLQYTDRTVTIEGHADEQGTREYNLALGARRASAVQNYLVSRGVADSRVRTVTFGKERPIEVCSEESCWARNRRAVTLVAGGLNS